MEGGLDRRGMGKRDGEGAEGMENRERVGDREKGKDWI